MDFQSLLQQAQKLTNIQDDLPRVERTMSQVLQATNELHSRVTQTGAQDIQAHIFLGSKGVDLPKISKKLEALSARKTFESLDPVSDTDIQSFLRNEKENAILSIIEDVNKNSYENAQAQNWDHVLNEWKTEKVKLMNALIGPSQNWIDIRKGPEQTILNDSTFSTKTVLSSHEMAYAREVFDYNKIVIEGAMRPSLVQKFAQTSETFNDMKIAEMWEIIKYMSNIRSIPKTQDPLKARFQKTEFVDQAKKYLESRYKLFMSTVISEHLRESQRGGVPSNLNLVGSFVMLKFRNQNETSYIGLQDGQLEGKPFWPMVYFCLRCGDVQSALKCLEMASPGHEDLIAALEEKIKNPDHRISSKLELQIKMKYKREIRNSTDPYKRVVYCVIGCCDIQEQHPEVAKSSEDFLWIQLSLVSLDLLAGSAPTDQLTYGTLQTMIIEQYGEKYYNASEQPHIYFQVLALTGQFEAAIEFLSRFDRYRTHAVHIALALNELHLIGGPRNIQEPLISVDIEDPKPVRRLNIARLVMLYVSKFEISDPAEALQYFYFLRNLKDPEGRNLFLACVADLVTENRNYDQVFGKIQVNGVRTPGLIDQFDGININIQAACSSIADDLVKKGLFEDAIRMYDLASNHEQALRYITILLAQVVHQSNKRGSMKERLQQLALELSERYYGSEISCDQKVLKTFNIFKDLVVFFNLYHENKHEMALEILAKTKLVPLSLNELDICLNNFKKLGGEINKVLPDLLLAAMDIVFKKYKGLKSGKDISVYDGTNHDQQLKFLREQAKAITNMAASTPYRMPGDINSRLIQTEILMH